jgi:cell division septation protein DedD
MEDQTSWKGHTFTLIVFTGIVVLCSIFFILGMLVGRTQGQKLALAASVSAAAKADARLVPREVTRPDLTFFDSVQKTETESSSLEPPPEPKIEPAPAPPADSSNVVNYQIGALRNSSDADKLLDQLKKKGFRAFILAPAPDDANPFFRVQVGPFSDVIEAEDAKKKLESEGYQPILKK